MPRDHARPILTGVLFAFLLTFGLGAPAATAREVVAEPHRPVSTFDGDPEGWTSSDGDTALSVADGTLLVTDILEDWHWLEAPDGFVGNWSGFARLAFSIRGDDGAPPRHPVQVEIKGPAGRALYELHSRFVVAGAWRRLSLPLVEAHWQVVGNWDALLMNVRSLRIRLDLNSATDAMETNALDDVRLVRPRHATFDWGLDGWQVEGGKLGNGGGHLEVVDEGGGWCWIRAPHAFEGNWSRVAAIALRVRPDPRGPVVQPLRVQIESPHGMAILQLPVDALRAGAWRQLELPLDRERWAVSGDWGAILRDVDAFWIRADLTDAHDGQEVTALDAIRLLPVGATTPS